ncbi:MAG: hypothetical protein ACRCSP_06835 [Rhodoglobus sp.]
MFKKILAVGSTIAIAAGLSVISVAGAAQATHPVVTGTAVCNPDTGQFDITWRVSGDTKYAKETATIVKEEISSDGDDSPVTTTSFVGLSVKGSSFVEAVQKNAQPGSSYVLGVKVQWTNHAQGKLVSQKSQPVVPSGTCVAPPQEDAAAELSTTAATCEAAAELILGAVDHAVWGEVIRDGKNYSVTATADKGHIFASGPGVSDDGTTKTFEGALEPQKSGKECAPTPTCIPSTAVSYTYDGPSNSGVITVSNVPGSTGKLCNGFWVTATSWKYLTEDKWPQSRDQVNYVNNGSEITTPGDYPFQAVVTCGQGDIYASYSAQPEPTPILNGPSDPFKEVFLHSAGFNGPRPTYFNNPTGCNTVVPVAPEVTTAAECGVAATVVPATTAGIDYAVELDTDTGNYTVTATPQTNYVFAGDDDQVIVFTGNAGAFVECVENPEVRVAYGECVIDDSDPSLPTASRSVSVTFDNSASNTSVEFEVEGFPQYTHTVPAGEKKTFDIVDSTGLGGEYVIVAAGVGFQVSIPACDLPTFALVTPTYTSTQPTCTAPGTYTLGSLNGDLVWTVNGVSGISNGTYDAPSDNSDVTIVAAPALAQDGLDPEWVNPVVLEFAAPTTGCELPTLPFNPPTLPLPAGVTPPATLALTGAAVGSGLAVAAGLLFLGVAGVVVARRRSSHSA